MSDQAPEKETPAPEPEKETPAPEPEPVKETPAPEHTDAPSRDEFATLRGIVESLAETVNKLVPGTVDENPYQSAVDA